jgi:hypothetical protein
MRHPKGRVFTLTSAGVFGKRSARNQATQLAFFMKGNTSRFLAVSLLLGTLSAQAQVTMNPYTSFGGGDGWLSPGEGGYTYLTTGTTERGLAYGNGHLYLVSRAGGNFIRILDPTTGADLGALNNSGISGGTFAINTIAVGGGGTIYVNNLTTQSTTTPLKIYSWATEGAAPVVAYSGNAGLAGSRAGDSLAAIGSGSSTRLAVGYGSTPAVPGNNGYGTIDPTASTATAVGFTGTPPNAGDFRLGLTFTDSGHIWGTQGTTLRYTSFSGSSGTLLSSFNPISNAERLMGYTVLGGKPLLAVQSTGDSHVSVYDVTDPNNPLLVASGNNTSGTLTANGNGTGEEAWGQITANGDGSFSETLYSMSTGQGIQAFNVTVAVPEPGSFALFGLGLATLAFWRKGRQ